MYRRLAGMAGPVSYSMAWSVASTKFIFLYINFSHYLNQRISDTFFQTNKCQAYRMKFLVRF